MSPPDYYFPLLVSYAHRNDARLDSNEIWYWVFYNYKDRKPKPTKHTNQAYTSNEVSLILLVVCNCRRIFLLRSLCIAAIQTRLSFGRSGYYKLSRPNGKYLEKQNKPIQKYENIETNKREKQINEN